jgi:predicted KAP-like P-loop ATPase
VLKAAFRGQHLGGTDCRHSRGKTFLMIWGVFRRAKRKDPPPARIGVEESPQRGLLLSDKPITSEAEDRFGFRAFADAVARSLLEMVPPDGLVISIEGEWGSGKTSALELALRRLKEREIARVSGCSVEGLSEKKPSELEAEWTALEERRQVHIVRFNPWIFAGQENLVRAFFVEVGASIGHGQSGAVRRALDGLRDRLPAVGAIVGAGGGLLIGGPAGAAVGATAGRAGGDAAAASFKRDRTLETLKRDLAEALRDQGSRIVIVMDDLDRLSPDEMRLMFSLVKSLGDLPNVVYLLCFDRKVVTQALSQGANAVHLDFLEKIIQVHLQLPLIWSSDRDELLFARLNAITEGYELHDAERWARVFRDAVAPYFETPRDVGRLANALQVIWPPVAGDVDITDLVLLTTLQIFEPSAYQLVAENIEALSGDVVNFEDKKEFAIRLTPGHAERLEVAKKAMAHLFPRLAEGWGVSTWDHESYLKRRGHRRISTSEYYRNYFAFGRDPDRITKGHIRNIVTAQNPAPLLKETLERLKGQTARNQVSRVSGFLEQLIEEVASEPVLSEALLKALLSESDWLIRQGDEVWDFFFQDNLRRLVNVVTAGLETHVAEKRADLMAISVSCSDGFTLTASVLSRVAEQHGLYGGEAKHEADRLIPDKDVVLDLIRVAVLRIRTLGSSKQLLASPRPGRLLWLWHLWAGSDEVRSWVSEQLEDEKAVLDLVRSLLLTGSYVSAGAAPTPSIDRAAYGSFIDIDVLMKRLTELADKAGSDSEQRKLKDGFIAALEAHEAFRRV